MEEKKMAKKSGKGLKKAKKLSGSKLQRSSLKRLALQRSIK